MGREIATLVDKIIISGDHRLKWIPSDDLAAGVYVVRIHNGSKVEPKNNLLKVNYNYET